MIPAVLRFVKYMLVGGSTFGLDLALMHLLISRGLHYPVATFLAFFIAVSINYLVSRRFVFRGTSRSLELGYLNMLTAAAVGAFLTASLTVLVVQWIGLHALLARLPVACLVGIGTYLFNLYANFKVAGHHPT